MLKRFWPEGLQLAIFAALFLAAPWLSPVLRAQERTYTVEEALNVGSGLGQLSSYDTTDKDGKPAKGYYDFPVDTRILMALNLEMARRVQTAFERAAMDVRMKFSGGAATVPPERMGEFTQEIAKLTSADSRHVFHRIKLRDLCMKAETPDCKAPQPIPPSTLSLILPIIDRDAPKK